ncbi:MAG: T9SS type A sorting domain-containing protein [Bacteroidales bacterium]|nr:T9SS type A sorting domain-containing protein [Bacteroidales bacterium]
MKVIFSILTIIFINFSFSQNPNALLFYYDLSNTAVYSNPQIVVYNTIGELVYKKDTQGLNGEIDLQNTIAGVYYYQIIHNGNLIFRGKLLKF